MTSVTNSEIDCYNVIEESGTMTCVKPRRGDKKRDWSAEATAAADALSALPPEEQAEMIRRIKDALGVEDGKYIGADKPIPQWTNQQVAAAAAAAAAAPEKK